MGSNNTPNHSIILSLKLDQFSGSRPVSKYLSAIDGLEEIAERFRSVVIENKEATEVVKKYDRHDALIYCDPPYLPETRHGSNASTYAFEMSREDHVSLLETIRDCKGRVIISGYSSDLYNEMLSDWKVASIEAKAHIANSGQRRKEILWMNY